MKPRLHNSIIICRSGLCLATVTVSSNLLQRLQKFYRICPQFHSPLFLIVIFARIYKTVTCDTICTADDHVEIGCKEGASKGENIYPKILRKLWLWLRYLKAFKNSVLVFICKLANQRRQLKTTYSQIL
jgi:hypothetical protein